MPHLQPFSSQEMSDRLRRIRTEMLSLGLDTLVTSNQANIRYATEFRGEPHTLLLTQDQAVLYTSYRTLPWAKEQTQVTQSHLELSTTATPWEDIAQRLAHQKQQIGVDHTLDHLTFLKRKEQLSTHQLLPCDPIERTRRLKSASEIKLLEQSQRINESIFSAVLPAITPGMSERVVQGLILAEIAKREEVDNYAFAPIVAAGGNAWEIHHLPDDTLIQRDDMLLLDLGIVYQGYASDMTRTVCMGAATPQMHEVYDTVRAAQEAAIASMRPGSDTREIDQIARTIITHAGHGKSFTHGLGHSIGLETHDPGLALSPSSSNEILAAGMAFTVEPGIYLEEAFGVRTEDVIIITEQGHTNITQQKKDLIELKF